MATYSVILRKGEKTARAHGMEASGIKLLLLHFSQKTPTELYLDIDKEMPETNQIAFFEGVDQYVINHRPVQYIMGYVSFYGYDFLVDEAVLIPRFETEELVANVLMQYDEVFSGQSVKLVDIGTGSGCLAITFAKEEPKIEVTATDISEAALLVAKHNALRLDANITFIQGDMLNPISDMKFDIIVSNPPYIPDDEVVADIIKDNEPNIALFGGVDGLKFYRIIIEEAQNILNQRFIMAFEHGFDKAEEIRALAKKYYPSAKIFTIKDMQNKDRMTFIVNK